MKRALLLSGGMDSLAVAWWLRDLSKHDAARAEAFLDGPGQGLKNFAKKVARTWLPQG